MGRNEWAMRKCFIEYIRQVQPAVMVLTAAALMTHGSVLFAERIGVDTEMGICGLYAFGLTGRQGLLWLGGLLETGWLNPYLIQVLTIMFLILAPVAFGFLFSFYSMQQKFLNVTLIVLGLSYIVSPFWAAQIYFLNQCAQITCSCLLTAIAIFLAEEGRREPRRKWYYILAAVVLMQFIFGSYQILVMLYITGTAVVFLCSSLAEKRTVRQQLQWILAHAGIFLAGFTIYLVIAKCFYLEANGSAYLSGQIAWGREGLSEGLQNCFSAVAASLKSNPPYYTGYYGIYILLFAGAVLYTWVRSCQAGKSGVLFLAAAAFLVLAPYVFIFVYGQALLDRMQLVMPLSQGGMLYLGILMLDDNEWREMAGGIKRQVVQVATLLLSVFIMKDCLMQMGYCNRMYYTDEWRYQYDKQLAHDIYRELQRYLDENGYDESLYKRLLFMGKPEINYNESCIKGDVIGTSIFASDMEAAYRYRIILFMRCLGYPMDTTNILSQEAAAEYNACFRSCFGERAENMPVFPAKGSIEYLEDEESGVGYLVVKLGQE